jgi:hypothetical protein
MGFRQALFRRLSLYLDKLAREKGLSQEQIASRAGLPEEASVVGSCVGIVWGAL